MELKIKNEDLKKLDREIFEYNKKYGMVLRTLDSLPNIGAIKEIISEGDLLKSRLQKIKTSDEFEKLLIENCLTNLDIQNAYVRYFSFRDKEDIEELSELLLGEKSIEILKNKIKDFDYKGHWKFYLSYQEYAYKSIPCDDMVIQNEFKKILEELKKDILKYAISHFGFDKKYDFDLVLGQPYSDRSNFHPTNRRMEIAPSAFFVFKEDNKVKINVAAVIETLFHELIGHGRHEYNSRELPESLQDNSVNICIASTHLHAEGIAQLTFEHSIKFMEEYKKKYNIEDDYINQIKLSNIRVDEGSFWCFYQFLKLKNLENNKFDFKKEFNKITNNFGLSLIYNSSTQPPFSFFRNAVYPLGDYYMKQMIDKIEKEYGKSFFQKHESDINKAISTGLWNIKLLPKFLRMYLNDLKN
jgi:hypothetical protein